MTSNAGRRTAVVLLLFSVIATAQTSQKKQTLVINGRSGDAIVYQIDGRSFVDLETLVRIANGSMTFGQSQIILTLPPAADLPVQAPQADSNPGLSSDFRRAAVSELAALKEWINILTYAAQRGVPGDGSRLVVLHDRALEALKMAQVAASTNDDQNAFQLLSNDFNSVNAWNDRLVKERRSMDTGKYSMSPDALTNDPAYQKIANCTKFLGTMLPSGTFQDDGSCH